MQPKKVKDISSFENCHHSTMYTVYDNLAYLESAPLCIKRELVKAHGTDEGDVGCLAVKHLTVCRVDPQPCQL